LKTMTTSKKKLRTKEINAWNYQPDWAAMMYKLLTLPKRVTVMELASNIRQTFSPTKAKPIKVASLKKKKLITLMIMKEKKGRMLIRSARCLESDLERALLSQGDVFGSFCSSKTGLRRSSRLAPTR